jgi:hypothetical protein
MMKEQNMQRSIRYLPPYEGESFSHYLGRWMRRPAISILESSSLSKQLNLGVTLWRWERFYFNPPPSEDELAVMGEIMDIDVDRLRLLFPPKGETVNTEPIRLCAVCYGEKAYHRMAWQYQSTAGCEVHHLRLLSRCISCGDKFPIPVEWQGRCNRCKTLFKFMKKRQKAY